MRTNRSLQIALCMGLILASSEDLEAQRRTAPILGSATIIGVSPDRIAVEPGGSIRFSVTGRNLSAARELQFFTGIRPEFAGRMSGRVLEASASSVSLVAEASRSANPGASYAMKLLVGGTAVPIPGGIEIIQSPTRGIAEPTEVQLVEPDSVAAEPIDDYDLSLVRVWIEPAEPAPGQYYHFKIEVGLNESAGSRRQFVVERRQCSVLSEPDLTIPPGGASLASEPQVATLLETRPAYVDPGQTRVVSWRAPEIETTRARRTCFFTVRDYDLRRSGDLRGSGEPMDNNDLFFGWEVGG